MVFIDEKGKKYEIQYQVFIKKGEKEESRQYVWTSKASIQRIIDGRTFDDKGEVILRVGYISGHKRGDREDELYINKNRLESLEIRAKDRESAKKIIKCLKL